MVDPTVALPYWDPTLDDESPNPIYSTLWSKELMGEQDRDGYVRKSPFKTWTTLDVCIFIVQSSRSVDNVQPALIKGDETFKRDVGRRRYLMTESDVKGIIYNTFKYQDIFAHTTASLVSERMLSISKSSTYFLPASNLTKRIATLVITL